MLDELESLLPPGRVVRDAETLQEYGRDWTRVHSPAPCAVVFPESQEEVSAVLRVCHVHRVGVVPSGGRTGLAAGAVAAQQELVLSLERMNRIGNIDAVGMSVRVEAGAITQAVHDQVAEHGLTWPVDFASKGSSSVGGNIATNAGGVKVIRYGLTRQWVLGLEVVLADGQCMSIGGALEKDNTGVDLRQLFIGSEGILGVITAATLKLTPLPGRQDVLLFAVDTLDAVLEVFRAARRADFIVGAFEFFTERCLARLTQHRGLQHPLESTSPFYVLLEVEAHEESVLERWLEDLMTEGPITDGTVAANREQAAHLWSLREGISESLSATGMPHKNDIALPIASLPAFCARLEAVFEARYPDWEICLFGHIGDGNLHVNVMKPEHMPKAEFLRHVHEADRVMFELVQEFGGSISAEHGIGLLKRDWLGYSRGPTEIAALHALKAVFDPRCILNPGKVVAGPHRVDFVGEGCDEVTP